MIIHSLFINKKLVLSHQSKIKRKIDYQKKMQSSSLFFRYHLVVVVLCVFVYLCAPSLSYAQTTASNITNTTMTTTTTTMTTTTTTTLPPETFPPPAPAPTIYNLFEEDKETYSNAIAMAIAAGVVSAFSGNPISVMYTLRTNMALSLCFEPVEERVAVMQFPFLQKLGSEPVLARYVGAAAYNVGAMIILFLFFIAMAFAMKSAKHYTLERANHKLLFPGILYPAIILLGGPSLYCAAGVMTKSSDPANIVIAIVALVFWAVVVIILPIIVAKVFDAEYIITQNVESQEQEKLLALTGLKDEATNSSRDSGSDKSSVSTVEENDGVREPDAYQNEGAFAGIFSKLREGIEGMKDNTVAVVGGEASDKNRKALSSGSIGDDDEGMYEEHNQEEDDMKQLAASTVDVLRQMFHHVKRTGGDEEKLLAAVHGTGEWRDKKKDEDFLEEEAEEDPISFMRRYGLFFEQYNKRNRFHGFIELLASFATCACANFWFFPDYRANCMFQSFVYLGIALVMLFLLIRRRPFSAKINHGYTMSMIVLHILAALCFAFGVIFEESAVVLTGYIIGIMGIYLNAFRALLDLYLVIVTKISSNKNNWPAIQELTDLFLAAKDRRDKGQMLTGPEMTNDRASARSGRSAKSAASRRSTRYTQQYGKNGIQLFFKMSSDGDRFSASRAIPEEYHPFIMRPLPEPIVLVPEERRQAIREKMEKAAAKAKWEAALNQLSQDNGIEEQLKVSAAEQFKDEDDFDEEAAAERERKLAEERKKAEAKSVPKLVRELFQMGLKTKFDEADKIDMEQKKIDDLLFPTQTKRADLHREQQKQAQAQREMLLAAANPNKKKDENDDKKSTKSSAKDKKRGEADVDEAFSSWIKSDTALLAEQALRNEKDALIQQQAEEEEQEAVKRMSASARRRSFIQKAKEEKKHASSSSKDSNNNNNNTEGGDGNDNNNNSSNNMSQEMEDKSRATPKKTATSEIKDVDDLL